MWLLERKDISYSLGSQVTNSALTCLERQGTDVISSRMYSDAKRTVGEELARFEFK